MKEKMKSLFEKIKSLDKKVLIGAGTGLAALIIAVVVILVVCLGGKDKETYKDDDKTKVEQNDDKHKDEEKEESDNKEATFTVKVVDADGAAVAGVTVQLSKDENVTATSDDTGVATFNVEITEGYKLSVLTLPEGYEYTGEAEIALTAGIIEYELKIQKKAATNSATQQPTATNPSGEEIFGAGSKEQPYLEIPNLENMTLTTVSIPAGKTLYYGIQRVGNMILTIENANAYVIESNGTRHDARGGKVSFTVENVMPSDYVIFQIGNKGGSAASFTIKFSNPTGSQMNPTTAKMSSNITVNLSANDSDGHWYKYIAERTGKIRFYLLTSPDSNILVVTRNGERFKDDDEKYIETVQSTTDVDAQVDSQGTYVEIDVQQGDEIVIQVGAKPNQRGKYPAATITWCGKYN